MHPISLLQNREGRKHSGPKNGALSHREFPRKITLGAVGMAQGIKVLATMPDMRGIRQFLQVILWPLHASHGMGTTYMYK